MSRSPAPSRRERVLGCFAGGAVGDALGAPVELFPLTEIRRRFGADGVRDLPDGRGSISDETQLTLFTAEGLADAGDDLWSGYLTRLAPHLHQAYQRWLSTQTHSAPPQPPPWHQVLPSGPLAGHAELYVNRSPARSSLGVLLSGRRGSLATAINDERDSGGVARVAPIGLVDDIDPFTVAAEAASITHGHPTAYLAAGAFAVLVAGVSAGRPLAAVADQSLDVLARYPRNDETSWSVLHALELADREPVPTPELVETLGAGWDADEVLAIALYAALTAPSFEAGVRVAVNHSGDSDATGALAGNLLGAQFGLRAVPPPWLDGLAERDLVLAVADDFAAQVCGLPAPT